MSIKVKKIILPCISGIFINITVVIIVRVVVIVIMAMVVDFMTIIIGVVIKIGIVVEDAGTNSCWKFIPLLGLSMVGSGSCI